MPKAIKKFKSRNLKGETRKEEARRISKARTKAILAGRSAKQVRRIGGTKKRLKLIGFSTN